MITVNIILDLWTLIVYIIYNFIDRNPDNMLIIIKI